MEIRRSVSDWKPQRTFDRLDIAIVTAILGLIAAIGLVLLGGDRVGISVRRASPQGPASSQSAIQVTFDETIDPASIDNRIAISPQVDGALSVVDNQISFRPGHPLNQGQVYTVTVKAGLRSKGGRALVTDYQWQFSVRPPQVVYLAPASSPYPNLFLVDPENPEQPEQLTHSEQGILGFDVAPDGSQIVYSQYEGEGAASLYVWDLRTNTTSKLLDCVSASCANPVWRPDGSMIAFEHVDLSMPSASVLAPRIWLLDLNTKTARPVFTDNQRLGYTPRWSPDGSKLALYDQSSEGIVIYDVATQQETVIKTPQGEVGQFSPDGRWLFFPKIVFQEGARYVSHLVLVDISGDSYVQRDLVAESSPVNDVEAAWRDDKMLVVARRIPQGNAITGAYLYSVDIETGEGIPLVTGEDYSNASMLINRSGDRMLFQRFAIGKPGARGEIWIYDFKAGELKKLVVDGTAGKWLP